MTGVQTCALPIFEEGGGHGGEEDDQQGGEPQAGRKEDPGDVGGPGEEGRSEEPASSAIGGGKMYLHDCLYDGVDKGMDYAKEIVESNTNLTADAVVLVYDEGVDNIIDSVRPLKVNGVETNLTATDIIRENDAYNGYAGNEAVTGTMSRADAVMVLVKALAQAAADPNKKATMIKTALQEYSNGNIIMKPEGSFTNLLATKGIESLG